MPTDAAQQPRPSTTTRTGPCLLMHQIALPLCRSASARRLTLYRLFDAGERPGQHTLGDNQLLCPAAELAHLLSTSILYFKLRRAPALPVTSNDFCASELELPCLIGSHTTIKKEKIKYDYQGKKIQAEHKLKSLQAKIKAQKPSASQKRIPQ